ncbi:MAG: SRPBCC domain-containing protein [Patescibacteria group bacterium]
MSKTDISRDFENKTVIVKRTFAAPRSKVWKAFTDSALLEKWWAPKPWKAVTKNYSFTPGGEWLYYMEGPEGEKSWTFLKYEEIQPEDYFTAIDGFCDENGVVDHNLPSNTHWKNDFIEHGDSTEVVSILTFDTVENMQKLIEMQFEGGYTMGLNQLEELLAS